MLKKLPKEKMGTSNLGWLESRFHFSFANYRNYDNMNFGVLRVLNDDIIHAGGGFDMHPHDNMEIVSYVVNGEITHADSMGNTETLKRGEVQYMSAGTGIVHSEYNHHPSTDLRLLQMWLIPPQKNLPTLYGSHSYTQEERKNKLLNIVSSQEGNATVKLYQDVNIFVSELDEGRSLDFVMGEGRQIYFVQIEGSAEVNGVVLEDGDAMEIVQEERLEVLALVGSHFLFVEMGESE